MYTEAEARFPFISETVCGVSSFRVVVGLIFAGVALCCVGDGLRRVSFSIFTFCDFSLF